LVRLVARQLKVAAGPNSRESDDLNGRRDPDPLRHHSAAQEHDAVVGGESLGQCERAHEMADPEGVLAIEK
jgi:hypothetical protein